jgi:hypothetical protein
VAYLDAAQERVERDQDARMDAQVEAVRIGYLAARDKRIHQKWVNRRRRHDQQRGLTGQALEHAIMSLARQHPEYVSFEGTA